MTQEKLEQLKATAAEVRRGILTEERLAEAVTRILDRGSCR